jgi:hypothetical protein
MRWWLAVCCACPPLLLLLLIFVSRVVEVPAARRPRASTAVAHRLIRGALGRGFTAMLNAHATEEQKAKFKAERLAGTRKVSKTDTSKAVAAAPADAWDDA